MKKILLFLSILLLSVSANAGTTYNPFTGKFDKCVTIEEEDGTPSNLTCGTIKVTNTKLTDNGDGTFSLDLSGGGGSFAVTDITSQNNVVPQIGDTLVLADTTDSGLSKVDAKFFIGREVHNVLSYGATGDGSTDDSAAIQSAINAVSDNSGGTVYFPPGTYLALDLTLKDKLRLTGEGPGISIIGAKNQDTNKSIIHENVNGSTGDPLEYVLIDNLEFDGSNMHRPASYSTGRKAIYITYMRKSGFSNLYIHDFPATCMGADFLVDSYMDRITTERCGTSGEDLGSNGIGLGIGKFDDGDEPVVISQSIARDIEHAGIMVEDQSGSLDAVNMIITDSIVQDSEIGFQIAGAQRVTLSNVIATDNTDGMQIIDSPLGTTLDREIIIANSQFSYNTDDGIDTQDTIDRLIMTGLIVEENGDKGIVGRATDMIISDSIISDNTSHGVMIVPETGRPIKSVLIKDNITKGNSGDGIHLQPGLAHVSNVRVQGNLISDNGAYGLQIQDNDSVFNSSTVDVTLNTFDGNTTAAVLVDDDGRSNVDLYFNDGYDGSYSGGDIIITSSTLESSGRLEIPNGTALPGTCDVGNIFFDTDATSGQRIYGCESANTWSLQGDGGGGGASALADLSDVNTVVYGAGRILIGDGISAYDDQAVSGDISLNDSGAVTIQNNAVQIDDIDSTDRSGSDGTVITGTAGSNGHCAQWNADGDLVTTGAACGGGGGGGNTFIDFEIKNAKRDGLFVTASITGGDVATSGILGGSTDEWSLVFPDNTDTAYIWSGRMPGDYSSAPILEVSYYEQFATSGDNEFEGAIMCTSDGDDVDMKTPSFSNIATSTVVVPGTAGRYDRVTITLNDDSCAANDHYSVYFSSDADDGTNDDAEGKTYVIDAGLSYTGS
jgi:hypothetical protein